jgi:hypothetical protein
LELITKWLDLHRRIKALLKLGRPFHSASVFAPDYERLVMEASS